MKNIKILLQIIWAYVEPFNYCKTDKRWDNKLNDLIDNHKKFERTSGWCVKFDDVEVWAENYPYGYGSPRNIEVLPFRKTRAKLRLFLYEKEGNFYDYKKFERELAISKLCKEK